MWNDLEDISGLPSFRFSGCNDVSVQDKLSLAKQDLDDKLRQLEFTNTELSRAKANHAEFIDIQLQLTEAKREVVVLQDSNEELSRANTCLESENFNLTSELSKLDDCLKTTEVELAEADCQRKSLTQKEIELTSRIAAHDATIKKQTVELNETKHRLKETQSKHLQLGTEKSEIESALKDREEEAESLKCELQTIRGELEATKQQLKNAVQRENDAVTRANLANDEAKNTAEVMNQKLIDSCNEIRKEMSHTHKIEVDAISSDVKRLTEENYRVNIKYEHCHVELRTAKESNAELSHKLEITESNLKEEQRQREILQSRFKEVSDENEQLRKELGSATDKLSLLESRAEATQKQNQAEKESLQKQLADAKKKYDAEWQRNEALLKEMEDQFVSFARDIFRSKR